MKWVSRHLWSVASGMITAIHWIGLYEVTSYLFRHKINHEIGTELFARIDTYHEYAIVAGVLVGIVAVIRERPPYWGILAILFALLSYFFYAG